MSLDITAQATTLYAGFALQAFQENNIISDDMIDYVPTTGTQSINVPKTVVRNVTQSGTGSALLSVPSNTDGATTVSLDNDTFVYDMVKWSQINSNGGQVPVRIAEQIGSNIAMIRQNNMISLLMQGAIGAGNVTIYDNEDTAGSAVYNAFLTGVSSLGANFVPNNGEMYCELELGQYLRLRTYAPAASRDFIPNSDNSKAPKAGFVLHGVSVTPCISVFNKDMTTDSVYTNIASKYKFNFATATSGAGYYGVIHHKQALTVLEAEKLNAGLSNEVLAQSWVPYCRYHSGSAVTRTEAVWALKGDNS